MTAETPAPLTDATPPGQGAGGGAWWFVDLSEAVRPGTQARRMILGEPVLVGRTRAGAAFALRDICPHRAAPLSAGRIMAHEGEGETVECPYHGWRFRTDGGCAAIPSLVEGDAADWSRIRVRAYPLAERHGLILVWMGPEDTPVPPGLPTIPWADGRPRRLGVRELDRPLYVVAADLARDGQGESEAPLAGCWWPPGRAPILTCLTPLDTARTRVTRLRWSGAPDGFWAGVDAGGFRRR
jgi:nitrite reductase/ring-hydroxylating ferredoxin subunit